MQTFETVLKLRNISFIGNDNYHEKGDFDQTLNLKYRISPSSTW